MTKRLETRMEFLALRYSGYEEGADKTNSLWHQLYKAHKAGSQACYTELEPELTRLQKKMEIAEKALSFDYEYYEAKPHKCLSLLNELKLALEEIGNVK